MKSSLRQSGLVVLVDMMMLGVSNRDPAGFRDFEDDFGVAHEIAPLRVVVGDTEPVFPDFSVVSGICSPFSISMCLPTCISLISSIPRWWRISLIASIGLSTFCMVYYTRNFIYF